RAGRRFGLRDPRDAGSLGRHRRPDAQREHQDQSNSAEMLAHRDLLRNGIRQDVPRPPVWTLAASPKFLGFEAERVSESLVLTESRSTRRFLGAGLPDSSAISPI